MMKTRIAILTLIIATSATGGYFFAHHYQSNPQQATVLKQDKTPAPDITDIRQKLEKILALYRQMIVLLNHADKLSAEEQEKINIVGQTMFHERLAIVADNEQQLNQLTSTATPANLNAIGELLDGIESGANLYDADRLAYREILQTLQAKIAKLSSLPAIKLHKRIGEDIDALDEIEHLYEKEIHQIFGRFSERGITLKREKWDDYVAYLNTLYTRESILKAQGVILPYKLPAAEVKADDNQKEVFGYDLPPKTIALTFDDGPHHVYTAEIAAILKQYNVPAVFFNVGRNLGVISNDGTVKLSKNSDISRKLETEGFVLGNHSYTHAQLSKESGDNLKAEILNTDRLLKAVDSKRAPLFRFPYGAKNSEATELLKEANLRSIMWNIDSLDWADPVPASITERVLQAVDKEKRGIILFHDIHDRAVKALPGILDKLTADGYRFAGWDGNNFSVAKDSSNQTNSMPITTGYENSWAIVIGIDDYLKWPKLQYAVRDAESIRQSLIEKFGFSPDKIFLLKNAQATRNGILAAFHDQLEHNGIKKNDRIFVFYAGHGATKHLSSGRDLGYLIPVDSNPDDFAADAIPMTDLQNIAESMNAKHLLFVMDACYSGLGLTRGGGNKNFLRDNARRVGRQMLTAGGADQLVTDGGPNGHSVFTWAVLQGLAGKGDLNGDGFITATELAAYVAPAVSNASQQTPAFGSLPGSEGGEFVFELPSEAEFLNASTTQLSSEAIALNNKLDAGSPQPVSVPVTEKITANLPATPTIAPVTIKNLQGKDTLIKPQTIAPSSVKQLAQRANDRGLQHYREKEYANAEADFTEALKLRPDFALAANNLGYVYYKQEKFQEAARWFENTIKIDPSRAIAYANLGDAYIHLNDQAKAVDAWKTYLALAPTGSSASYVKQQLEKIQ